MPSNSDEARVSDNASPTAAATRLLRESGECLTESADLGCWKDILGEAQPGSLERLSELARAGLLAHSPEVSLVDELGSVALMAVSWPPLGETETTSASLLIIKSEAGWRIREVY
ncbi:hypothetical protein GCM10022198_05860 [Klugiella xanthotipulae]